MTDRQACNCICCRATDTRGRDCALGVWCLHRDTAGQWLKVERTALDEPIHAACADTGLGVWLKLNHARRALGRALFPWLRRNP